MEVPPMTQEEHQAMEIVVKRMEKLGVIDIALPPELWRIVYERVAEEGANDPDTMTILQTIETNMHGAGYGIDKPHYHS